MPNIYTPSEDNRWSEHGLGHLLNPTGPESEDREWIAQVWYRMICNALGLHTEEVHFAGRPAVGRITVSSPALMRPLTEFNRGKAYPDQIKPFNFLLTCHVKPFGHPPGADPAHFHLIAPYQLDPKQWTNMEWIDQYSRKSYRISATGPHGTRFMARVKTYGDVLQEYEFHPESKCADTSEKPCSKQTVGLLQRRHIRVGQIKYIGKESNSLEDVQSGLIHSEQSVYTEYPDPRRDEWKTKILPALGRCSTCSCSSAVHFVPSWTSDSTLEVKLHTFSPAMAQIVADLQKSAAAGNLCSSMLEGKTILVLGDPRTIVSWRFFSLRDGVDHLETDKGEAFEASPRQWTFYVNKKEVTRGEVEVSPVHGQNKRH